MRPFREPGENPGAKRGTYDDADEATRKEPGDVLESLGSRDQVEPPARRQPEQDRERRPERSEAAASST